MNKPNIFFRLTKVDVAKREVTGIATAEHPDQTGEICDYETTKPFYQKWSANISKSTGGKSLGNVREMHSNIAAGKVIDLQFDDAEKLIRIVTKCVDDSTWTKIVEGVLTGFSQGGDYVKKWKDGEHTRYTADPSEISYVDNPCLQTATFEIVKADGSSEMRKFHTQPVIVPPELEQVWKAKDGSTWRTKAEAQKQNTLIDARAVVAKTTEGVQGLLNGITDALDKRDSTDAEGKPMKPDIKKLLAKSESWDAETAIQALQTIEYLMSREEDEAEDGEDEAGQVADLKTVIERLKSFIASEIMENTEEEEPEALAAARAAALKKAEDEMPADHMEHVHAIHKAASHIMKKCMKCMGSEAEKVFKALADGEEMHEHIESIHKKASKIADHAVALGSKLQTEDDEKDGKDDDGDDEDTKKFMKMAAENSALTKALTGMSTQLTEIQKRLSVVENQPAARKGKLMIVTKGHEREEEPESAAETHSPNLSGLSPEEARKFYT